MTAPPVLDWARRLHAVAQTGLAYPDTTGYDRDRYEHVRRIAAEMLAANGEVDALDARLALETGHATPKLDVRGVVFSDDTVLLVREKSHGSGRCRAAGSTSARAPASP